MVGKYDEVQPTVVASTSKARPRTGIPAEDADMAASSTPQQSDGSSEGSDDDEDEDDEDDDEDPIVRRLPVYYNPSFLESLCLLQYPDRPPHHDSAHPLLPPALRPDWSRDPSPSVGRLQAQYKPHTQHLEVTLPMERHAERWNDDHAKRYAEGVVEDRDRERERQLEAKNKGKGRRKRRDGAGEDEDEARYREEKESRRLDKMVYASSGVPEVTSYLIGVVKNDALHLNPVNQTLQLRPSLTYLDNLLALERRAKRAAQQAEDDSDEEISDTELKKEQVAKAVQVQVKQQQQQQQGGGGGSGADTRGASALRSGGLFAPMRAEEAESWKPLKHYHANTDAAEDAFQRMFAATDKKLKSATKPKEYLG
ncbi:hypothetical protein Rhopal_004644-T1 [Rhodotorula paludigena]|uniref:Uncharacterized protein n=1 Tax=Rhodotorula paludigena TaxID=86838 RepID=A0AAV5GG90_9BASI|nr:hypothetical protein Rhopal_004644-T1 [Rhodotorula paludigena]